MIIISNINRIAKVVLLLILSTPAWAETTVSSFRGEWHSILPPLLAIIFALVFKRVIPALFLGLWLGTWIIHDYTLPGLGLGLLETFEVHIKSSLADSDHAAVILFSMMIGGMVGIISRNGGMQGIVQIIVKWASNARQTCMATIGMGMAIFFDDYANTLVVGNTMRPLTDTARVSREKLAYIVDSTAAPVACIALITTWVGYEIGLIGAALEDIPTLDLQPYLVFLNTIPYSFYPILALSFVLMIAWSGRDFGPMLKAERMAREHGVQTVDDDPQSQTDGAPILPVEGKPQRAINALLPVAALIITMMAGLYVTGKSSLGPGEYSIQEIVGAADSYRSLMWASLLGVVVAVALSLGQRILNLEQVVNAWYRGVRAMLKAIIILILAWSLGAVTGELGTSDFLVQVLGERVPAWLLPALVFVIAAATGFGTGSSWGAMAILVPLVIPLTWAIMQSQGLAGPEHLHILYSAIAAVLCGSVWGDHCSPISDTTILSSLASGCDHVEHVRTQLPYAGLVGLVSIALCSIPVALGMPWWAGLLAAIAVLATVLRLIGQHSETA